MTIIINTKPKEKTTTANLQEKVGGFKFQMPNGNKQPAANPVDEGTKAVDKRSDNPVGEPARKPGIAIGAVKSDKPKLQVGKPKNNLLANKQDNPDNPIPEMSDDKYEVVANSTAVLSEESGNSFQQQLDMLQQAIDGTGDLKDQMVNILTFLDDNPEYKETVSPQDVSVFVAACRKVAGITVTEKVERKTKKAKVSANVEEVLSDLADLEFEL